MKVGDWVIGSDGRIGCVTLYNFMEDYSLVKFNDMPMASMRRKDSITPFDSAVSDILNAINTNERE